MKSAPDGPVVVDAVQIGRCPCPHIHVMLNDASGAIIAVGVLGLDAAAALALCLAQAIEHARAGCPTNPLEIQ